MIHMYPLLDGCMALFRSLSLLHHSLTLCRVGRTPWMRDQSTQKAVIYNWTAEIEYTHKQNKLRGP
jgi:hypothetical protein